jgi:hypothetical protein
MEGGGPTALCAGAAVRGEGVEIAGSKAGGAAAGGLVAVAEATALGLARSSRGGIAAGDGRAELGGRSHGGWVDIGGGGGGSGVVVHEILVLGVKIQSVDLSVGRHSWADSSLSSLVARRSSWIGLDWILDSIRVWDLEEGSGQDSRGAVGFGPFGVGMNWSEQ